MTSNFRKQKQHEDSKDTSNKVDTKYYDELFKKIKDLEESEDSESVEILYNNIIEQISESENELKKCLNSYHIDFFIYKSSLDDFVRLFELLTNTVDSDKIKEYTSDRRISRAYEACLALIGEKILAKNSRKNISNSKSKVDDTESEDEGKKSTSKNQESNISKLKTCLNNLGNFLVENFQSILETQDGIFTLRAFLKIIGNVDILEQTPNDKFNSSTNKSNNYRKLQQQQNEFNIKNIQIKLVPSEWKLNKFIKKMSKGLESINVLEIGLISSASPCISLLLRKLYLTYPELSSEINENIHQQFVKKSNSFHSMIQDSIGSRFIESFLFTCHVDLLIDFYLNQHIIPNIVVYSKHIYANYPIQTLLKHRLPNEPQLSVLFESLTENLDSIIDLHTDLIYKNYFIVELIDACQKCSNLDLKKFVKKLANYFGCDTDETRLNFLKVLLIYEKLEDIIKDCTIEMALFSFDLKPIATTIASKLIEYDDKLITKSFNNLNSNELEYLCTNNVGSHFIQQCLRIFNEKDRSVWLQSFIDKIKGRFLILSTNRSGSFVIETIWSVATLKQRIAIVDELKPSENQLKNDQFGRFFAHKIGLSFYKHKPDEWKQIQTNEFKKKKMLADLLEEPSQENGNQFKTKKLKK